MKHRRLILTATILGSSMGMMDGTVVNIALPALQATMGATIADVQWVVEAYTLFLAALMLTGGALGDRYGRKRIFLVGVLVFTVGSVACGLAPNMGALIAFRGLQGIGAALMVPGSLAIISALFADKERGKAIGTWSAFTSITMVIGPLVGGLFIDDLNDGNRGCRRSRWRCCRPRLRRRCRWRCRYGRRAQRHRRDHLALAAHRPAQGARGALRGQREGRRALRSPARQVGCQEDRPARPRRDRSR